MAVAEQDLTTVAQVKTVWGRPQDDTGKDTRIQALISLVSGKISDWCGRIFQDDDYADELYDGDGSCFLLLKQFPVSSIDSLSVGGTGIDLDDINEEGSNVKAWYDEGIIKLDQGFTPGSRNVKVSYTAGYDTDSIPPGLASCCVEWVIILLEGRMKDAKVKGEDTQMAMPDQIESALSKYKRRDF